MQHTKRFYFTSCILSNLYGLFLLFRTTCYEHHSKQFQIVIPPSDAFRLMQLPKSIHRATGQNINFQISFLNLQVTEKNDTVESTPSLINKSCYEDGWLFRLKLSSPEELKKLMDQAAYDKYLEESH